MTTDKIKAGKHFGIDRWHPLRHAALRLALMTAQSTHPSDKARAATIARRRKVGAAYAFYITRPELFWD